ncbi:ABC transporter ATP-binding protein [Paenibacillus sp. NPDC058071]|uniref:ABC transporter ATP-binding protein n=1 Tax=Paenibacillus sp. NPDC058071 TaxID=3346326 RepID=UPI0036DDB945
MTEAVSITGLTETLPAAEPAPEAISLQGIGLSYSTRRSNRIDTIGHIDLSIRQGEFVCLLGSSGCGKTSLLRLVAGYEKPTRGDVRLFGNEQKGPGPDIGVVFQHANLFPWLSVQRNAEFGLRMQNTARTERRDVAFYWLNQVSMSDYSALLPHQLSGGMKQRTAIARALAPDPRILLMDEPFGALDAITRESLQYLIRKLWLQSGKTVIFITHDVDEALLLGSRIIVMKGGPGRIEIDMPNGLNAAGSGSSGEAFPFIRKHVRFAEQREQLVKALRTVEHSIS